MNTTTLPPVPPRSIRNAGHRELVDLLRQQFRQRVDLVVPRPALRMSDDGSFELAGIEPVVSDDGVTDVNGSYRATDKALGDLAAEDKTGIPVKYLRRLASDHPDLLAHNVNTLFDRDKRRPVLVRALYGSDPAHPGSSGIIRAFLSDKFGGPDNLDTVFSVLDGMRQAGLAANEIEWRGADLDNDKLWLRIVAPEVHVNAENLLKGYKSPFAASGHGGEAAANPYIVHAGIVVTNNEIGGGAFTITPELRVKICDNGLTINMDQIRKVHIGGRLSEGQVDWSSQTREAANALVRSQCKDAVSAFMTQDYVARTVRKLEADAGFEVASPMDTIKTVAKELQYSEAEQDAILACFTKSGQCTSGGVMQAVTAAAQDIDDIERSNDFAATGVDAMKIAARINR